MSTPKAPIKWGELMESEKSWQVTWRCW